MDAKYISTGKYASNNGQQPLAAKPGITVEQEKHIPLLNTKSIVNPATTDELSTGTLHKHDAFFNPLRFRQGSTLSAQDERNFDAYLKSCLCFDIANKSEASTENRHTRSSLVSPSTLESQGHAFIQLAQIVADQSISYGYILRQQDHSQTNNDQKEDLQNINRIITQSQTDNRALTLQEIVSLESNSPAKTEPARLLATSTIRVKRGEAIMDMSFAAIEYWKELGIKPLHNVKNVTAFCLYPDDEAYRIGSAKFLQQMSDAYRNLNLGSHSLGDPKLPSNINGLVPIPGLEALAINFKSVQGYCSQFG